MGIWLWWGTKHIRVLTSECLPFRIGSFCPKIEVFYRPELTKWGTTWKWILSIFKFRNECYKQVDEKWGHFSSFMFSSWVMVFKLSKKVHFLQFCAELSKKSTSIKAIYICASERYCYALSENDIVYYAITYCFGDIRIWIRKKLLNFCWVCIFFDI